MTGSISPSEQPEPQEPTNLLGRFIYSSWGAALAKLPPVAWLTRRLAARMMTKRRVIDDGISGREPSIDLASALRGIAYDVVEIMGYAGAMVATYEPGDILPVRALYVDPKLISMQQVDEMVSRVAALAGRTLSLTDPQVARVFIHRSEYKDNLSVKAAQQQRPVISDNLFDLFTPIAPESVRPAIDGIQQSLGIRQVITVPFLSRRMRGAMCSASMWAIYLPPSAVKSWKRMCWCFWLLPARWRLPFSVSAAVCRPKLSSSLFWISSAAW